MIAHKILGISAIILSTSVLIGSDPLNEKHLLRLKSLYQKIEYNSLHTDYYLQLDTSEIDDIIARVDDRLSQREIAQSEMACIITIVRFMADSTVVSDGSLKSRWNSYAKQAIVKVLKKTAAGTEIMNSLCNSNPVFKEEVEAYKAPTDFLDS